MLSAYEHDFKMFQTIWIVWFNFHCLSKVEDTIYASRLPRWSRPYTT